MNPCSNEEYYYKLDNMVLDSCQHLRAVFKNRWKSETGEEWVDDMEHVQKFLDGVGQTAYKRAQPFQKIAIKSKCTQEWDASLLAAVIRNFGCEKKYETENLSVSRLKNMRNFLAHHSSKKISKDEYGVNVDLFRSSLRSLGMENQDIDKMIERAGVTSSLKALEYMNILHERADKFLEEGNYEKAVDCYSEAINVPSLLPVNLGTAHEKRAECSLKAIKDPISDREICDHASLDVNKAIELNDCSWMAYYLSAQCHRWKNDLSQAIHHYERSLAISPVQKQVKNDMDACKILLGVHNRLDHLNPQLMPMNLEERVKHLENETQMKMTQEAFIEMHRIAGEIWKGQDHVFRGHQYYSGWGVPIDFMEAVRYYTKAAIVKNPEGMYNLGKCYYNGHGVKQNIKEALRIYKEVAEMDPKTPGQSTPSQFNCGVACAQHGLGLMYDEGIGVDKNYAEAARWYKKSMENGLGFSANNLGLLYANGMGVAQDWKMAEMCWKQAVNLKDFNAPASLMGYYMDQMEPEKAMDMVRIGREMGTPGFQSLSNDELNRRIAGVKSARQEMEPEVLKFESLHNLKSKGLTFQQRMTRKNLHLSPNIEKMRKLLKSSVSHHIGENGSWGGKAHAFTLENFLEIEERASGGSVTALNILETFNINFELNQLLEMAVEYSETQKLEIINHAYNCAVLERHLVSMRKDWMQKLKSIVASLFEEKCETKGNDDMKIRYCFVSFNLGGSVGLDDTYGIELLKEGIRRYPDNVNYYYHLSCRYGFMEKFPEGRLYADEGLGKWPDNVDLLYMRAVHLRKQQESTKNPEECIAAYNEFLSNAPFDHRKVPESYYQISFLCMLHLSKKCPTKDVNSLEKVQLHYKLGQEAEKRQLPCYLPYGESDVKRFVEVFLTSMKAPSIPSSIDIKAGEEAKSVLVQKEYLKSPTRKSMILKHRELLKSIENQKKTMNTFTTTMSPKFKQKPAKKMSVMKPITLLEMNPTEDHIFENRILDLTIMEDPNPNFPSIHMVAEDESGDLTRLYIYNVDKSNGTLDKFRAGCRLAIINPYMRIGSQSINNGIRNDEPRCIVYLEKVESMCRFCGEGNASRQCSKCKRPYCSRECQLLDWKEFNHKLICSVKY